MSESSIPAKRPSPPAVPGDATLAPNKIARLETATPANPPTTTPGGVGGSVRRPKTAALFDGARVHEPAELGGASEQMVDQHFEVDDGAEYSEALLLLQTLFNRLHHPTRPQVRMLLALALCPLLFTPRVKSTNPSFKRNNSAATQGGIDAIQESTLQPHSDEPFVLAHRKLREQALAVLQDVTSTSGVEVVCRAMRGSDVPETPKETEARLIKEEVKRKEREARRKKDEEDAAAAPAKSGKGVGRKKASQRQQTLDDDDDSEAEDFGPGESDDPIVEASKRIGQAEDFWDFLAGTTAKKSRLRTRENPVAEAGGWPLLQVLVRGWEDEHARKEKCKGQNSTPPLSVLRYFKPSASTGVAREVSTKALDVVFWPFSAAAAPKDVDGSSSSGSETDGFEDETQKSEVEAKDPEERGDGMDSQAKREVAMRLLGVIGSCAVDGWLSGATLLAEIVQRMKALEHADFLSFVETLSLTPLNPSFTTRLLTTYIETHSHFPTLTPGIVPAPPLSALPPSSTSTSPRKRILGTNSSFASLASNPSVPDSSSTVSAEVNFWRSPSLNSSDFLALLARIPIEVPIVLPPPAAGERRPKLNLPSTFVRAAAADVSHRVVKAALLQVLATREMLDPKRAREVGEVMEKVAEVVQDAKRRVEER